MKRKIFMLCVLVATMGALAVLIAGLILNHIYLRNAGAIAIGVCFIVFAAGNFVFLVKKLSTFIPNMRKRVKNLWTTT